MTKNIALINTASGSGSTFQQLFDKVNELANLASQEIVTANTQANGATTAGNTYFTGIFSANVVGIYGALRGGNVQSTGVLPITSNVYVSGNKIDVGNSTVNATVNSTAFVFTNSTASRIISGAGATYGNTVANVVINSISFTIANSTVSYTYGMPTAAQKAATTSYLNGNGSFVTTNMYVDGANTGFGAAPTTDFDIVKDIDSGAIVAALRNASTTASQAIFQISSGARYVNQLIDYDSQYYQTTGSNILTAYADFNTHAFRNSGGGTTNFQVVNNGVIVAAGNTGNRPAATSGTIRYNTEENQFEGVVSGAYDKIATLSDLLKVYDSSNTQLFP